MKKLLLLSAFFSISFLSKAQEGVRVDPLKDKMIVGEYSIVLLNSVDFTYGYDIRKGRQIILEQKDNPIFPMTKGLFTKQDAFNLAQWVIIKIEETGKLPESYPQSLYEELKLTKKN